MVVLEKGVLVVGAAAATAIGMYLLSGPRRAGNEPRLDTNDEYRSAPWPSHQPASPARYVIDRGLATKHNIRVPIDDESNLLPYEEVEVVELPTPASSHADRPATLHRPVQPSLSRGLGKADEGGRRMGRGLEREAGRAAQGLEQTGEAIERELGRGVEKAKHGVQHVEHGVERALGKGEELGRRGVSKVERAAGRVREGARETYDAAGYKYQEGKEEVKDKAEEGKGWFSSWFSSSPSSTEVPRYRADLGDQRISRFQEGDVMENKQVETFELRSREEHEYAERARQSAERAAAEAAAALAAAQAFEAKRREDLDRAQRAKEEAHMLEEAAAQKAKEARDAAALAKKEEKYMANAQADASRKLAEEDRALKETARYEERARADHRAAESERLKMAELRRKDAEAAALAASAARERADRDYERESRLAEESRRRITDVERLAKEADSMKARSAQEAAELLAREKELQAQSADLDRRRREAEQRAASASASREDAARSAARVRAAADAHEKAAAAAAEARARAEELRRKAEETSTRSAGAVDRLRGWLSSDVEPRPVTAVSTATGSARSVALHDDKGEMGTTQGRQVIASGAARVDIKEGMPAASSTGRQNAEVKSDWVGPDLGRSSTRMAESSRDVSAPGLRGSTNIRD